MRTAALSLFILLLACSSCRYMNGKRIDGNGNRTTQTRQVGSFDGVEVKGGIDVVISPGSTHSLQIEADENLLQYIEVENDGGVIEVSTRDGYNLRSKGGIKVMATAPVFERIGVSGSGDIRSTGLVKGGKSLELKIRGSGDIQVEVDAPEVSTEISGSGSARIQGNTRSFSADIRGSGDVHAFNLLSEETEVDIAGSGNAEVFASKKISVEIKGAGDVAYKGDATVSQRIKGSGSVRKVE